MYCSRKVRNAANRSVPGLDILLQRIKIPSAQGSPQILSLNPQGSPKSRKHPKKRTTIRQRKSKSLRETDYA